jgi:hypothetical protein
VHEFVAFLVGGGHRRAARRPPGRGPTGRAGSGSGAASGRPGRAGSPRRRSAGVPQRVEVGSGERWRRASCRRWTAQARRSAPMASRAKAMTLANASSVRNRSIAGSGALSRIVATRMTPWPRPVRCAIARARRRRSGAAPRPRPPVRRSSAVIRASPSRPQGRGVLPGADREPEQGVAQRPDGIGDDGGALPVRHSRTRGRHRPGGQADAQQRGSRSCPRSGSPAMPGRRNTCAPW